MLENAGNTKMARTKNSWPRIFFPDGDVFVACFIVSIVGLRLRVFTYRTYAVARSNATLPALRPFDKLRAGRLRMYGSMVLPISSVVLFSLAERKKNNKKKIKYRCE